MLAHLCARDIGRARPGAALIYGHDVTWQSAFLLTRAGRRIAILGRYDAENAHRLGAYDEVIAYDAACSEPLRKVLADLNPQQIALNYSTNNSHADGLTHGLFLLLHEYLRGTPFADRFVSAGRIVTALRSRKTPAEVERIRTAIATTFAIYQRAFDWWRQAKRNVRSASLCMPRSMRWAWRLPGSVRRARQSTAGRTRPSVMPDRQKYAWRRATSSTSTLV